MDEIIVAALMLLLQGMMMGGLLVWVLVELRFWQLEKKLKKKLKNMAEGGNADAVRRKDHRKGD